jgi:hypothetical protein
MDDSVLAIDGQMRLLELYIAYVGNDRRQDSTGVQD